jgi:4-hydroxybenzoate polyprenyltransferase
MTILSWLKFFDYLFVLRPTLLFPVWTVVLVGHWAQLRFGTDTGFEKSLPFTIWVIASYSFLMGAVFILNQLEDIETDKINRKLYLIADGIIPKRCAVVEMVLLGCAPFLMLFWSRWDLFFLMILSFIVMGWAYSSPPLNLKNSPWGGVIANIIGYFLVFSVGWNISGKLSIEMIWHATPYILGILGIYFFTTIPDIHGDRNAHKVTVAVQYGPGPTIKMGLITNTLGMMLGLFLMDWVIFIPTLLMLFFYFKTLFSRSVQDVLLTNKIATLVLSLVVCYRFPAYLLLILIVYFLAKWYYRHRFQIDYPSFQTLQ